MILFLMCGACVTVCILRAFYIRSTWFAWVCVDFEYKTYDDREGNILFIACTDTHTSTWEWKKWNDKWMSVSYAKYFFLHLSITKKYSKRQQHHQSQYSLRFVTVLNEHEYVCWFEIKERKKRIFFLFVLHF